MRQDSTRIQYALKRRIPTLIVCAIWLLLMSWTLPSVRQDRRIALGLASVAAVVATFLLLSRAERRHWIVPTREMAERIRSLTRQRASADLKPATPEFAAIAGAVDDLRADHRDRLKLRTRMRTPSNSSDPAGRSPAARPPGSDPDRPLPPSDGEFALVQSADYSTVDMVNRLDPVDFVWIESSIAEQAFLGWSLAELRGKSFLDIIHQDDRKPALGTLRRAIDCGESLGQVVRILTASGEPKDVELNVGTRYGPDRSISHLRCHLTDVTEKVRAERELKQRTLELTRANEQLLRINRELEELKDRYGDLYQNAPAMYFSLDPAGVMIECNRTLMTTLKKSRRELVGQSYERLLPEAHRNRFRARFEVFLNEKSMEMETPWRKSNGEIIEVWIKASLVRAADGTIAHVRCVAQDVTTGRRLKAELERKNKSLGRANAELSQKNRELDDFVHVVSHDLQEPLRTLIAFSDFLLKDYGERFDDEGREYVNYLIDASRRMREMILAMLTLSRAGKVIGDFVPVDLQELIAVVRADLGELIRAKNAEVRVANPLPVVWGDWNRLTQLFANLIANGLKFNTDPSPWIEVGTAGPSDEAEDWPTLYVKDNGIGIDPEFHQTIFQLFRRLHTQDEYEGTGAGLAISAKIVHAHGGRIWVESSPGAGSTFYVRLRHCPSPSPGTDRTAVSSSLTVAVQDRADEPNPV
jgi:PAS domain S-box-containing protein